MSDSRLEWIEREGTECLRTTFPPIFDQEAAEAAIILWRRELDARPGKKVVHVWNCLQMKDYTPEARQLWSAACKEHSDQIGTIWVVGDSLVIKAGASVLAVFTSMPIKVVSSEDEIVC